MTKSSSGEFGGESSVKALELLRQYKKLSEKRILGLTDDEEKTLKHLELALGKVLDSRASPAELNKRKGIRVSNRLEVKMQTPREVKNAYIKNISGGGLYVETEQFQAVGSKITVHIRFDEKSEPEPVECEVAWVNPKVMADLAPGMGVKFYKISDKTRSKVQRLVDEMLESEVKKQAAAKKAEPKS